MSRKYHVSWEIDIEADSPKEAAEQALAIQRREGSGAVVFDVTDGETAICYRVDLDADPGEIVAER